MYVILFYVWKKEDVEKANKKIVAKYTRSECNSCLRIRIKINKKKNLKKNEGVE